MQKLKLALSVILPFVIALLAALFVCSLNVKNEENDLGAAFAILFLVLGNVGSGIACIPFATAFLVIEICLFAVKNQRGTACALLVLMSILLPLLGALVVFDAVMFAAYSPLFLTVAIVTAAVYLAAYVLCILYFRASRRAVA